VKFQTLEEKLKNIKNDGTGLLSVRNICELNIQKIFWEYFTKEEIEST